MRKLRKLIPATIAFLAVILCASSAFAQRATYRVAITNITPNQVISPPVVVAHSPRTFLFRVGREASPELAAVAEDADTSGLEAALAADPGVFDFAVAGAPLPPGKSVVLEVQTIPGFLRISAIGMLVTTNDAFFGLDTFPLTGPARARETTAPAYDAGTEVNNELCSHIPGPPCENPFVRETEGAEGFVHIHSGIHGVGDLDAAGLDWLNPVVRITLVRN